MLPIKTYLANRANYGSFRKDTAIKYIVIHYTGNDGDKSISNAQYFQRNIIKASAHYFIDDTTIIQSVPDNYSAYAVGGKKYNNSGGRLYGTVTNSNSISVELCDAVKNDSIFPTQTTINNAIELTQYLMHKYNIPAHRVIRHYDVNGKLCPAYWVNEASWKSYFWDKLGSVVTPTNEQDKNPYKEPNTQVTSKRNAQILGILNFISEGDSVKWVQWELSQVNESFKQSIILNGGIDGKCGPNTAALIKVFQQMYGLKVDGVCGAATRKALKAN